jgi:hypothetical protein
MTELLSQIPGDILQRSEFVHLFGNTFSECASKFRASLRGKNILEGGHIGLMKDFFQMFNDPIILKIFSNLLMDEGVVVMAWKYFY